eukprot:263847-Pyramimonas_sp.AAC.1
MLAFAGPVVYGSSAALWPLVARFSEVPGASHDLSGALVALVLVTLVTLALVSLVTLAHVTRCGPCACGPGPCDPWVL